MGEKMLILSHWATLPEARQPGGCLGMENKIWEWFTLFMAGLVLVETPFLTKWMIATFVLPLFAANGFCSNPHKLWLFYCHEPRQSMIVAYSGLPTSEVRNAPLEIFIGKLWNILERKKYLSFWHCRQRNIKGQDERCTEPHLLIWEQLSTWKHTQRSRPPIQA